MYYVVELIKDICEKYGENTALMYFDGTVRRFSYSQLNEASHIVKENLKPYEIEGCGYIGVFLDPISYFPAVIFGILLADHPFVCLDTFGSKEYNELLVDKLGIKVIITDYNKYSEKCTASFGLSTCLKKLEIFGECLELHQINNVNVEKEKKTSLTGENRMLYAIQTSGSTGLPKIVQVTESCIIPNILELRRIFGVTCTDVIYFSSPITFDPCIIELFMALTSGAALYIVSARARAAVVPHLIDVLFPVESSRNDCVTFIQTTPSLFLSWPADIVRQRIMTRLRILVLGGEQCPSWKKLSEYYSEGRCTKLYSLYGITEVSCWATFCEVLPNFDGRLLGTPMEDTLLQVRNNDGRQISDGIGELFIGSCSRVCILDNEDEDDILKKAQFQPIFRQTGDVVQVCDGGKTFRFLGRRDRIVKRWGHKVDLTHVEDVVKDCRSIVRNCSCLLDSRFGLVLFYSKRPNLDTSDDAREKWLRFWLAKESCLRNTASVPDTIINLDEIPLNNNGKVDISRLRDILEERKNSNDDQNALKISDRKNKLELQFKELWIRNVVVSRSDKVKSIDGQSIIEEGVASKELLNDVGFISSGGTSLSAVQLISELSRISFELPSDLITNLLSDCSFDNCLRIFLESQCESKATRKRSHLSVDNKSRTVEGPALKFANHITDICKTECESDCCVVSVKCRGRTETYIVGHDRKNVCPINDAERKVSLSIKWKYYLNKCVDASPTVISYKSGETIVSVGSHSGDLVNLKLTDGKLISLCHLPDRIESSFAVSKCGKYGYVGCYDGRLYCVEIQSGQLSWSFSTSGMIKNTPEVVGGGRVVFGSYDHNLYCVSSCSQEIWKWRGNGSFYSTCCFDPAYQTVFVGLLDGNFIAVDEKNGQLLWSYKLTSPVFSSPVLLKNGTVISAEVSGVVRCLNSSSGQIVWSYKAEGNIFSSMAVTELENKTLIVFGCHDSHIYCLSLHHEKQAPSLLWKTNMQNPVFATPFIDSSARLIAVANSTGQTVSVLDLMSGRILESIKLPGDVFSSPVIHEHYIVVGCRDDNVYCLYFEFKL